MNDVRTRLSAVSPSLLSTAIAMVLGATALSAGAAPLPPRDSAAELDEVEVSAQKVPMPVSPKYTQPPLDTPQTISVVTKDIIDDQNLLSLRDVLSTLPGITFGAGEGGGGFGDSINLRGFSANGDITVDGIRDSAQYSRNDTFNLEQVEVVNGANSVYSGSGSVGGTINLVSKVARAGDFNRVTAGVGTDSYARATADLNQQFSEGAAFRINAMSHRNDAPGRDVEEFERWGLSPSLTLGLGTPTNLTLSYLHQDDDNVPQYGVPYFNGNPLPGVDPETYFGFRNVDRQDIEVDSFTARVDHDFNNGMRLVNQLRQSEITQLIVVDPPAGTYCLANGQTPTGTACPSGQAPGTYQPTSTATSTGPRGGLRDSENTILVNQTDLQMDFATGGIEHNAVVGFSLSRESFDLLSGNVERGPGGEVPAIPVMDLFNPNNVYTGPINFIPGSKQSGEVDNRAIYAFDTLTFNPQWEFNVGVRSERNEGTHRTDTISITSTPTTPIGTTTPGQEFVNDDSLFSYRAGLVFKPVPNASIYVAHGNSETPSKATVNGACTAQTCNVDPESAVSTEIGAKWDLFDGRLSLTGALSRNERENYKVADPGNPENPSQIQQLDGQARVDAILLGVSGLITDRWAVYANYTHLDSEVLQGASDNQSDLGLDYTRGDRLTQVPEDAFNVWTTFDLNRQWQFGYGITYQGKVWLTQHSATNLNGPLVTSDDYTVHRLAATYRMTRDFSLQLNVNNVLDEEYYTRLRNNGWATPGDARQTTLTATYNF